jgi:uncharacterized protein
MSQENINIIKKIYQDFGEGNIPGVFERFSPEIEWIAAENSPAGPGSPYRGHDQVRDGVFLRILNGFDGFCIQQDELFAADDKVIMLGYYLGAAKPSGKQMKAQVAHIWTLNDSKVVRFQQYTDTYQLAMVLA